MTASDEAVRVQVPRLQVGDVVSVGGLSHGRLVALAAAGQPSADDPVGEALGRSLEEQHPGIPAAAVADEDIDRASTDRRYSLVRVRELSMPSGGSRDVMVMSGEFAAVLGDSTSSRASAALLRRNARRTVAREGRPFTVAAAPVSADGTVGEYRLQGFVGLHPVGPRYDHVDDPDESYVRVYLWSALLRWQHWLNVALILTLSVTGYLIMTPSLLPTAAVRVGEASGYTMGWVRNIHFAAAFTWLVLALARLVLAFLSSDRFLRWPTFWPLKSKADFRHLGQVVSHYALVRREAPLYLAHNPLQQLAYTALYVIALLQMASGFVLYSLYERTGGIWSVVGDIGFWGWGTPGIRLFHAVSMFVIWAFAIMHVYMALRADALERRGGISAMINGGVWLPRGSKPVDAPEVE
ncbi:MAG: Ni/Fe-hydrogenase, b-type cytochrome subunit [Micrococcales bacterium]|nr:Ni/Fe-hydrogenase, b-type cytochrome subunit [Micrococcales bacterium]MCL2667005.1 Ni/Fe-hydrogenase, b-type cytochrome subunit [Micrococcales bacterium]